MLEYLFFNDSVAEQFREYLRAHGITFSDSEEPIQNALIVELEEPDDDELWDELDALYDQLSVQDQALMEAGEEGDSANRAGIYLQLENGQQTVAKVDPEILNRILTVVNMEELNVFLDTVVKSVEHPDDSPICKVSEPD